MDINVSAIINEKLAQLEADGTIKRKIEESLEKSILSAISSELESYSFRRSIEEQLKAAVSTIAADCGLSAYNGFIAERCKQIVQHHFTEDIGEKVHKALTDIMFEKHTDIKLSDIFERYREWVLENTEESEKYERGEFTHALEVVEDGNFTRYVCKLADHVLENKSYYKEKPDVEIHLTAYGKETESRISMLFLNGHYMKDSFKVGPISTFEAFILNLYYNETKIILDEEDVDTNPYFDVDI